MSECADKMLPSMMVTGCWGRAVQSLSDSLLKGCPAMLSVQRCDVEACGLARSALVFEVEFEVADNKRVV